jgi:putative hydrolase of the HAD superfamily
MCDYLDIEYDDALVEKLTKYRTQGDYKLNKGVKKNLERLSKKYRLGVLSNSLPSRKHHELKIDDIDRYFDQIIISSEEGVRKPNRKIYEIAIESSGFKPNEILFIDDKVSSLKGAVESGIENVVLYKTVSEEYPTITTMDDLK